jgi:pentatricopeptide repeat protein
MARKSIEHSDEIVTETLAKVYAKQGNIAKAKRIYGQLILKNPEKKTYFASLIKQLETE